MFCNLIFFFFREQKARLESVTEKFKQIRDTNKTSESSEAPIINDQAKNGMKVLDLIDKFNNKEQISLATAEENKKVLLVDVPDQNIMVDGKTSNGDISSKKKLEEMEINLKKKCEELRLEFENIKKINENALLELHKNKVVINKLIVVSIQI